jgi:hypothetical protein
LKNVLLAHQSDPFCTEMACNVALAFTMIDKLISQEEMRVDLTSCLLISLKNHLDTPNIVKSICMALSSLISFSGNLRFFKIFLLKL